MIGLAGPGLNATLALNEDPPSPTRVPTQFLVRPKNFNLFLKAQFL